jgi:Protein of unknown function (DUF1236)
MNKHLVSVSLAALLATAGIAFAQSPQKSDSAPADKAPPAAQTAPADKGAQAPAKENQAPSTQKQGGSSMEKGNQAQTPKSGDATQQKADTGKKDGAKEQKAETGKKDGAKEQKAETGKKDGAKDQKVDAGKKDSTKEASDSKKGTTAGSGTSQSGGGEARQGSQTNVTVNVTTEQKTRVRSVFSTRRSSAVVANINITPRVGIAVPRTVTLAAIPDDVIVIVPEYRRYRYFIVGDQVVIVDPDTFLIVDVILLA